MVPRPRVALSATDRLLAGYLGFTTVVVMARGTLGRGGEWLLAAHAGFGLLLWCFTRLPAEARIGRLLHDFYPLLMIPVFYAEIGHLNDVVGLPRILDHDLTIQHWEQALFGGQVAFEWIRVAPSVFWSGLLHVGYLSYYPIILLGAPLVAVRASRHGARRVIFAMMAAFVACCVVFLLYPVAGPNYAFPHPTGPVRDVWSARLVYTMLEAGSSVGAAFPSSHVAATVAVVVAAFREWRALGVILLVPAILLITGTVYCQMHYGVDAATGLVVGLAAGYWVPPSCR